MVHILDVLKDRVLLCDGGTGSRVQALTLDVECDYLGHENCTEILTKARPDIVRDIHRSYLKAGSDIVQTNTFGGSPITLGEFGLQDLAYDLNKTRTVETLRAARICAQIATALDYAHRQGVVHRDVKPDNVLFDDDGNAILTDFGIATARFHGRLTAGGRAMGTPHYMAPEQAMGKTLDGRADLYAVGVMLYECLAGFPPFDGVDGYSVGYKHVHEKPVPIGDVEPMVPAPLAQAVMRCLEKDPNARPQRGQDLSDLLLDFLHSVGHHAPGAVRAARPGEAPPEG